MVLFLLVALPISCINIKKFLIFFSSDTFFVTKRERKNKNNKSIVEKIRMLGKAC